MQDDRLLAAYTRDGSEAAFSQLVARHLTMVYKTCLREIGSSSLAEDAAQVVFLLLARKAKSLRAGPSLAGWLYKAARFVAKDVRKQEARRQRREQTVVQEMTQRQEPPAPGWERIEALLNDALSALKPAEREAVLLRFLEGHSLAETGAALGLSEDAARMRVSRAVEKMRCYLTSHGAAVTGAVLTGLLTAEASRPVPAHAANVITQGTLQAASGMTNANIMQLLEGVYRTMWMTNVKIAAFAAAVLLTGAAVPPLARALSSHKAGVRVLTTPPPLAENVTTKFMLDKDQHAFYSATLPKGASMIILDMQRPGGKAGDIKCSLAITDKDASRLRGSTNATGGLEAMDELESEMRVTARSILKKPKSVLFDVRNQGGQCQYWLTVFHAASGVSATAPEASPSIAVPLFGTIVPTMMVLGESKTGSLAGGGNAYFLIPLKAGRYQSFLDFSSASGKSTELNGALSLTDEEGFPYFNERNLPPGNQTVLDNNLHWPDSPYRGVSKFTLKRDSVFLVRIANQPDDAAHAAPVNFSARILPDSAAPVAKQK